MRTTLLTVLVIGLLASRGWAQQDDVGPPTPTQAPKIVLDPPEWDFGLKWFGEPASTQVTVRNEGNAPLEIKSVRSSCGCTVAKPNKTVLQPGESDTMSVRYNTKKRARKVHQSITINTNDPARPAVRFTVRGEVKMLYEPEPTPALTFGRLGHDEQAEKEITLTNNYDKPVKLELVEEEDTSFAVKLVELEAGQKYKLIARTKPPLRNGGIHHKIRLNTDLESFPQIEFDVQAFVQAPVTVAPEVLYVPKALTRSIDRQVRLHYRAEREVKITAIKPSIDSITYEIKPPQQIGNREFYIQSIIFSLPPGDEIPEGAKVEILTSDPEFSKFVIDVTNTRTRSARR